jgi:hypothetical protein
MKLLRSAHAWGRGQEVKEGTISARKTVQTCELLLTRRSDCVATMLRKELERWCSGGCSVFVFVVCFEAESFHQLARHL